MRSRAPRLSWPIVLLAFTAVGVLRFTYLYLDDLARSTSGTLLQRIIEEGTGAYAAMALFPLVAWVESRWPFDEGRWRRNWLPHAASFVAYSATHTSLLWLSRSAIFPALGLGEYLYGRMPIRYFMEAPQDLLAYAFFIGTFTLMRVHETARERELRSLELARDAARAQLTTLSLRLQPHFLFNALNTISSALYADPVVADTMIGHLGDLLRHSLRTGERVEIAVEEEAEILGAYLALVEARFGDRVRCVVEIDPAARRLAVPAFLLQPLVENAVRHGAEREDGGAPSRIEVIVRRDGGRLRLTVENDAPESPAGTPSLGTGLGTTAERLRLLHGDDHELSAASVGTRFRVSIAIPARLAPAADPSVPGARGLLTSTGDARSHR